MEQLENQGTEDGQGSLAQSEHAAPASRGLQDQTPDFVPVSGDLERWDYPSPGK